VIGHLASMARDPLRFLSELAQTHGDVVSFKLGTQRCVLVNDPSLIEFILRDKRFTRAQLTQRGLNALLGPGLLSLEGDEHKRHRRLMQPAFHRKRLDRYVSIMAQKAYQSLTRWESGEALDMRTEMKRLTFAIVITCLFNAGDDHTDSSVIDQVLQRVLPKLLTTVTLSRVLSLGVALRLAARTRREITELHALVRGFAEQRRAEPSDHGDLLSMLLATRDETGSRLSDDEIAAEYLTILLAGHDTTTSTLSWAWYLLTENPKIQEQLAHEVQSVCGDRPVRAEDLPKLELASRVMLETMRLYPAAWMAERVSEEAVELGAFTIPAGTPLMYSPWVIQRDARYFSEPERFDPDRFRKERFSSVPHGAFVPFGGGAHICIGNTLAITEAQVILAAMAQRFTFRCTRPISGKPKPDMTLSIAEPFLVQATPRAAVNSRGSEARSLDTLQ
jgi:cytochrome P450